MGRWCFARGVSGRGAAAVTLSVLSILASPSLVGNQSASYASGGVNQAPTTDIEAASTMDLTGLQGQFAKVCEAVSSSVVAISASCTPINDDDALRT